MPISPASLQDVPELVALINSAYRGEVSKKGWTTEAFILGGELRIDAPALSTMMNNPRAIILKYTSPEGIITGSVFLEKREDGLYLGMLSVSPLKQAQGIGNQLLSAAERFAKENNCPRIFMNVISVRHELIAWYERRGYRLTGETKPLPPDTRFGMPLQPLEFAILEKII